MLSVEFDWFFRIMLNFGIAFSFLLASLVFDFVVYLLLSVLCDGL